MNKTRYIYLKEDHDYKFQELVDQISVSMDISENLAIKLAEEFITRLRPIAQDIKRIRSRGFKTVDGETKIEIESIHPYIEKDEVNMGQWIGVYRFYSDSLGDYVFVSVKPKVGYEAYLRMLSDVWDMATLYGPQLMNYVFNSIYGLSSYYIDALYSYIVSILTQIAIFEGLPVEIFKEEKLSKDIRGRLNSHKIIKYLLKQIYPYTHIRTIDAKLPRILLQKFNLELYLRMKYLAEEYSDVESAETLFRKLASGNISNVLSPDLIDFLHESLSLDISDPQIIERLLVFTRRNRTLKEIIYLYLSFLSKRSLISDNILVEYKDRIPIMPLPSSKIYELWVLKLILDELKNLYGEKGETSLAEGGIIFTFRNLLLNFNYIPREWSILIDKHHPKTLRPDYVITVDSRRVVMDAKYRNFRGLALGDLERMIAYIVDVSTIDKRELSGYFIVLKDSIDRIQRWMFRTDIYPEISIYVFTVDPRYLDISKTAVKRFLTMTVPT